MGTSALPNPAPSCCPGCTTSQDYGNAERSGKMQVLARVLQHWHAAGHK